MVCRNLVIDGLTVMALDSKSRGTVFKNTVNPTKPDPCLTHPTIPLVLIKWVVKLMGGFHGLEKPAFSFQLHILELGEPCPKNWALTRAQKQ